MAREDGFYAFVRELFAALGPVEVKRMFGGAGAYAEGRMFALLADGTIYLKADDALAAELEAQGCGPFIWEPSSGPRAGDKIPPGYWRLPDAALDDAELACGWGRKALAVALSKPAPRRASRTKSRSRAKSKKA